MHFEEKEQLFMNSMHRMKRINCFDMISGMTKSEVILLKEIIAGEDGTRTVSDLQCCVKMHPTAVSRLLNSLEEKGYIERTSRKGNRRVTDVKATALGKEVDAKNKNMLHEYWNDVFAAIPDEDLDNMLRIWGNIMDSMERVFDEKKCDGKEL